MITAITAPTGPAAVLYSEPFTDAAAEVRSHRRNGPATVVHIHRHTYRSSGAIAVPVQPRQGSL
jgi:hypothetical protein